MSGFFIGIDVGGTNLKAGLTDETGRLLAAARRPLDFRGAETFAADLADLAAEVLSAAGAAPGDAEGVGIGLYLARQIAAGQGGYLKVSSRPGEGSTFSLFLPRAEERT